MNCLVIKMLYSNQTNSLKCSDPCFTSKYVINFRNSEVLAIPFKCQVLPPGVFIPLLLILNLFLDSFFCCFTPDQVSCISLIELNPPSMCFFIRCAYFFFFFLISILHIRFSLNVPWHKFQDHLKRQVYGFIPELLSQNLWEEGPGISNSVRYPR